MCTKNIKKFKQIENFDDKFVSCFCIFILIILIFVFFIFLKGLYTYILEKDVFMICILVVFLLCAVGLIYANIVLLSSRQTSNVILEQDRLVLKVRFFSDKIIPLNQIKKVKEINSFFFQHIRVYTFNKKEYFISKKREKFDELLKLLRQREKENKAKSNIA